MEKELNIKARDGMIIKGTLYGQSDKLIIFLHGLGVYPNDYLAKRSAELFMEKGYSVFTYNQYSDEEINGRKPRALYGAVTLKRHSEDLEDIVKYFAGKKIYLIGHSFGGLTLNRANTKCIAQALWDPTFYTSNWEKEGSWAYINKTPMINWSGQRFAINAEMIKEAKTITKEAAAKWTAKLVSPTLVINTTECAKWNKDYQEYLPRGCKFETMDTSHMFHHLGKVEELCEKTIDFFER